MTLRHARPNAAPFSAVRRFVPVLLRAAAVAAIAATPLALPVAAGAQDASPTVPNIPPAAIDAAGQAIGTAVIDDVGTTGWLAGDGVVVTSIHDDVRVGDDAYFLFSGSTAHHDCYVAKINPRLNLTMLRCNQLPGTPLKIATAYPVPGTPVVIVVGQYTVQASSGDEAVTLAAEGGTVTSNDFEFMGVRRPQFSLRLPQTGRLPTEVLTQENHLAIAVLGADGKVVSTILATPERGGQAIGTLPSELRKWLDKSEDLPLTFGAAALLTTTRRALIPMAVGLVAGLLWGAFRRDGKVLIRTFGMTVVGLAATLAYSGFVLLVVGPQSLVG